MVDKRALKILHDAFWSPGGWKHESDRALSAEDFDYAKEKGVMFDPVYMDHAQAVATVHELVGRLDQRTVVNAFLSSLSTRRLDWRSALGSYTVFRHLVPHEPQGAKACELCGFYLRATEQNFNVLNFERTKWGGVRHLQLAYAAMDLNLFLKSPASLPTRNDVNIFQTIAEAIRSAGPDITAANLHSRLPKTLKSNKAERDVVISILGFCDVLAFSSHPGFTDAFIPAARRILPSRRFVDVAYPACWWTGEMGINETKLKEYFGHVM
ncbi:hypothetical protein [Dyella sp. GSA-30]|uniref:hypothetical protein n=1 Tax=Dyella sp. GSA-30 TaxID=2994496 RepID=UPI0024916827|nr:hypothetical protein [Dyella sp. GSA-30]BDU22562.1 hypothetical protein DYGSA30_40190 [Dyella sp. GSA-30]